MKTFITTILCVWASSTFALAPSTSVINRSEVKTIEQRHHKERASRYHSAMSEKDFQFLYKIIKKKSFDDDRMEILSVGVLDNYFTCHQCVRLMSLYKFDDNKLKIIRIMAGHIVDLENHYDILMRLDFDSNKRKALEILNVHDKGKR
jgi:hypothetical protein